MAGTSTENHPWFVSNSSVALTVRGPYALSSNPKSVARPVEFWALGERACAASLAGHDSVTARAGTVRKRSADASATSTTGIFIFAPSAGNGHEPRSV